MNPIPKPAGTWDWAGALDPRTAIYARCETFSVGIFQWVQRKNGDGVKRGKVVMRIKGRTDKPNEVYLQAQSECIRRNKEEPRG